MTKEEKLKNLYEGVLENKELTTGELKSYGFSSKDLTKLVRDGVLVRQVRGLYEFKDAEAIYQYRLEVIPVKMGQCIDKCYEIDSKHVGANLKLFARNIKKGKLEVAISHLDNLYFASDDKDKKDYNLFLLLLDMMGELPSNLKDIVRNLTLEDVLADEAAFKEQGGLDNEVRRKIFQKQFLGVADSLEQREDSLTIAVLRILLHNINRWVNIQFNISKVNQLIKDNRFKELLDYYNSRGCRNFVEDNLVILLNDIKELLKNGRVQKVGKEGDFTLNLYKAIDEGLYNQALDISIEFCEKNGKVKENNSLYLLLVKINSLIEVVQSINAKNYERLLSFLKYSQDEVLLKEYLVLISQAIIEIKQGHEAQIEEHDGTLEGAIRANDFEFALDCLNKSEDFWGKNILKRVIEDYLDRKNSYKEERSVTGVNLIFHLLTEGKIEAAYQSVHEYLLALNLDKYEFLIVDLINLSLAMDSLGFMDAISTLIAISKGNFVPQYGSYVDWFYEAIHEGNVEEAKIYFDIISGFKNLGEMQVNMDNMRKALANLMQENAARGRLIRF